VHFSCNDLADTAEGRKRRSAAAKEACSLSKSYKSVPEMDVVELDQALGVSVVIKTDVSSNAQDRDRAEFGTLQALDRTASAACNKASLSALISSTLSVNSQLVSQL
jgi:hypothetical protein